MERILAGVSATLTQTVTIDEVGTDPNPDAATVTITRADGTPVVTGATAINGPNGGFTYTLVPAQTAILDRLTAAWTFTLNSQPQTLRQTVEVVGGRLCSLQDVRQLDPIQDGVTYSTAKVEAARTLAETVIEKAVGFAFVPRYSLVRTRSGRDLPLYVRRVRSATDPYGTALGPTDLAYLTDGQYNIGRSRWGSWVLGVEHGWDEPPDDVRRATAILTRSILMQNQGVGSSGFDERATSVVYADAGLTYSTPVVTAGMRGAETSIPEVNSVIQRYQPTPVV